MADRKYSNRELEEYATKLLTEAEIKQSNLNEVIDKLQKENESLKSELASFKRKDRASARAITLAERKTKYILDITKSRCAIEIDRLTRLSERYSSLFDQLEYNEQQKLEDFNAELNATINTLSNLGVYVEDRKPLSAAEKNYIAEKERISLNDAVKSHLDDRFSKLMSEFKLKIGESASRGRGRPKKSEESILVEVNKVIDSVKPQEQLSDQEKQDVINKINDIFYSTKASKSEKVSKNNPAGFDFDDALNPTISLADIMKDLI